jgi:SAM-dependent methyltransferase
MTTRLARRELRVARRYRALHGGRSLAARLVQALGTPLGNYLVNTPLFLLPQQVNLQPKHRVLEVGCGTGANLRFLVARVDFQQPPVGMDLSRAALAAGARPDGGPPFVPVQGTASRLPFADESFDLVIAGHVVRHLSDEGLLRLVVECQRVLRPGGLLALWEFAPTSSRRLNALNARVLDALGGAGKPRSFGRLADFVLEAHYDVIERPRLRPFLFPPVPRTSLLAKK